MQMMLVSHYTPRRRSSHMRTHRTACRSRGPLPQVTCTSRCLQQQKSSSHAALGCRSLSGTQHVAGSGSAQSRQCLKSEWIEKARLCDTMSMRGLQALVLSSIMTLTALRSPKAASLSSAGVGISQPRSQSANHERCLYYECTTCQGRFRGPGAVVQVSRFVGRGGYTHQLYTIRVWVSSEIFHDVAMGHVPGDNEWRT